MAEAFKPFLKKSEFISSGDPFTDSIVLGASNADMNNVDYGAFKDVVKAKPVTTPVPTATNVNPFPTYLPTLIAEIVGTIFQ